MTDRELMGAFSAYGSFLQRDPKEAEMFLRVLKSEFYGDSFSGVKSPEELVRIQLLFKCRLDANHKCCHCGTCCDRVLGLTTKESRGILHYLEQHPEVKEYINKINEGHPHRKCPFLDHTKKSKKCMIYGEPFYPIICTTYCCDEGSMDPRIIRSMYMRDGMPQFIDMWHYFLDDPVDIAQSWRKKDLVSSKYNIRLGPAVLLEPEKLNENLKRYLPEILLSLN